MVKFFATADKPTEDPRGQANMVERRGLMDALDASQSLVWFDANGMIVDANDNSLRLFAYSGEEILKQDYFALCGSSDRQQMADRRQWNKIASGELNHTERSFVGQDGSEVWSSVNFAAILNEDGTTRRVVAIFIDMGKFAWKPKDISRVF